jgi:hypothetical protein
MVYMDYNGKPNPKGVILRRKRELRMQVHKIVPEGETTQLEEDQWIEKLLQIVPKFLFASVLAIYGYVILDTWRQVTVEQSKYIDQEG